MRKIKSLWLLVGWHVGWHLVTISTFAQDIGPSYQVDLSDAINHYVSVSMTAESTGDETQVMMAIWTPGSYLVQEYAKQIDFISASDPKGEPLQMDKISKNRWRVKTAGATTFQLKYRIYCNEKSVRTNWVGLNYGVLNGAPTFLTVPEHLERPHSVSLKLPKGWKKSATSLLPHGDELHHFQASNYHELVDSPIVAGNLSAYAFKVADVEHKLVNINVIEQNYWNGEEAARDLAKVIAENHKVWGTVPYNRYLFLNVVGSGNGGLEHDNCCLIGSQAFGPRDVASYKRWLSLASHEFFHAWNIRRLRPKSLLKYDYETEIYTPSLWVAEGITSYYEDLLLVRAGLITQDDFIKKFSGLISGLQRTEGRKVQSLRDSSHDAWIKFYRPTSNSRATQISYYTKGAVVSFLLDARIRTASDGKASLDDVLKTLFEKHAGNIGFLPSDFQAICSNVAGENLDSWFTTAIDSTDELDYQFVADWFGLEIGDIKPKQAKAAGEPAAANSDEPAKLKSKAENATSEKEATASTTEVTAEKKPTPWLGIGVPNSPASTAGLVDSDEVIAINGIRVRTTDPIGTLGIGRASPAEALGLSGATRPRSSAEAHIQDFDIGTPIKILISRDDAIQEILAVVGTLPELPNWGLSISKTASALQKKHLAAWLNQPLDEKGAKPNSKPK